MWALHARLGVQLDAHFALFTSVGGIGVLDTSRATESYFHASLLVEVSTWQLYGVAVGIGPGMLASDESVVPLVNLRLASMVNFGAMAVDGPTSARAGPSIVNVDVLIGGSDEFVAIVLISAWVASLDLAI